MRVLPAYAAPVEGRRVKASHPEALELGVGKASAAACAAIALARQPVEVLLLFGVCGAYPQVHLSGGEASHVGDLCLVEEDALGDEGRVTGDGFQRLDEALDRTGPYGADRELTARAAEVLGGLPLVRGVTVSTCSGTDVSSREMAGRSRAQVETMEGAAVALVCRRLAVPMVQLRCVSNHTGSSGSWQLETAVERVQDAVLELLGSWP